MMQDNRSSCSICFDYASEVFLSIFGLPLEEGFLPPIDQVYTIHQNTHRPLWHDGLDYRCLQVADSSVC